MCRSMSITLFSYQSKLSEELTSLARQKLYENVDERNRKTKEALKYINLITGGTESKTNSIVHTIIGRHSINFLYQDELLIFSHVCKDWNKHCEDPRVWSNMLMRDVNAPLQVRIDATNPKLYAFSKLYYKRQVTLQKTQTLKNNQKSTDRQLLATVSIAIFRFIIGAT